jgi:hypothetical protein
MTASTSLVTFLATALPIFLSFVSADPDLASVLLMTIA